MAIHTTSNYQRASYLFIPATILITRFFQVSNLARRESFDSPQCSPLGTERYTLSHLIKTNRKKRMKILLPYENFRCAIFGKEFQIDRLLREETHCKVYSVTRLDHSEEILEAKVFSFKERPDLAAS